MPHTHSYWRTDRPAEGFYTTELPFEPAQTVRTFLPEQYEPRYPYPLLVLFHPRGGNEEQVLRHVPRLSRRNFVAISLRGSETFGVRADGRSAYGWGAADDVADYLTRAVEQTRRTYHIHSERIYLVGVNEGAAAAYRAAFALGDQIAGVAALNGALPRPTDGNPLFRLDQVRKLRVFMAHGADNVALPPASIVRDHKLLYAAGATVLRQTYDTTHRVHPDMLRDLNRWIIGHVNTTHELLIPAK
ncbi:alpha/beta hydrolase [Fimbriiglobus ruber]|uniref:Serine esterase n=1 Tax=Fimbriiglobus ruber TaxID=1908690 RepID=A0A225DXI9_9BACT|nr:esterase [Fimbriiglobus ruber]OWK41065.1 Serine esterase [Fimbriiglobus ruber]